MRLRATAAAKNQLVALAALSIIDASCPAVVHAKFINATVYLCRFFRRECLALFLKQGWPGYKEDVGKPNDYDRGCDPCPIRNFVDLAPLSDVTY